MAEPAHPIRQPALPYPVIPLLVYTTWVLMLVADLAFVARYGSNVPSWDEWDMVPTMTGEQPITADWLWSQHNEHRIPVPRLVMLALYRLFGCDFRVGMYFNVVSTAVLALGLVLVAGRLRGRLSLADVFFPVLLLNWGQGVNFIWGWQVEFYLSTVLAGVVLLLIVQSGPRPTVAKALATGVCLALLVGSGAHGLALVPALACWLGSAALLLWRSNRPTGRRDALIIFAIALAGMLLAALYLVGYERVPYHPITPGSVATLATASKFLTMSLGPAVKTVWPFSGIGVLCLLLASVAVLAAVVWNQPEERYRALGLFFFLGAMVSLALAVGLGRNGFEPRYITLSVPVMCGIYFVWQLYGPPKVGWLLRASLVAVTGMALWPNAQFGIAYAAELRSRLGSFEQDMASGVPPYLLINRYGASLHVHQEILVDYMPLLRRAGVGHFASLRDDPVFEAIPVPLMPSSLNQVTWEEGTAHMSGRSPFMVFALPESRYVCGIRLRYRHANQEGSLPYVTLSWKGTSQEEFTPERSRKISPTGDRATWERGTWLRRGEPDTTFIVWVCDAVKQVCLRPDFRPGTFKITELTLLVPIGDRTQLSPRIPESALVNPHR